MSDDPARFCRSHCNQGEYLGECKYGDESCPMTQDIGREAKAREMYAQHLDLAVGGASGMAALIRSGKPLAVNGLHATAIRAMLQFAAERQPDCGAAGGYTAVALSDLVAERAKLPEDFPNYGDWSVSLPAGHWRAIIAAMLAAVPADRGEG